MAADEPIEDTSGMAMAKSKGPGIVLNDCCANFLKIAEITLCLQQLEHIHTIYLFIFAHDHHAKTLIHSGGGMAGAR